MIHRFTDEELALEVFALRMALATEDQQIVLLGTLLEQAKEANKLRAELACLEAAKLEERDAKVPE